jgi:hypothetical protein
VAYRRIVFDQKDPGHRVFPSRFQVVDPWLAEGQNRIRILRVNSRLGE